MHRVTTEGQLSDVGSMKKKKTTLILNKCPTYCVLKCTTTVDIWQFTTIYLSKVDAILLIWAKTNLLMPPHE